MNAMLIFFTFLSVLVLLFFTPVWFADSVETLNNSRSFLRYVPIVNECRAEILYWGFGPMTLSWILLFVMAAAKMLTWWYMYGTTIATVCHYGLWVAIAFWYIAKCINVFRLLRDMNLTGMVANIIYAIIYPVGFYMLNATCRTYKAINSNG